jgi:flagellar operon protein
MNNLKAGQIYYPSTIATAQPIKKTATDRSQSFDKILHQKIDDNSNKLTFSNHALNRLEKRGISLNPEDLSRLSGAVQKAEEKGAKESLILMKDVAFIVSVTNKKVITAMESNSSEMNVFTNIDSAVIA